MQTSFAFSSLFISYFDVDHRIKPVHPNMIPFDRYQFSTLVVAIDKTTNKSIHIASLSAVEGVESFVVASVQHHGKGGTFEGPTGAIEVETGEAEIIVERSMLAQAFTLCLFLINTALAIGSTYITLLVVLRREETNEGVLLLPVTIVLTIPTLRTLFVGSPPFGIFIGRLLTLGS